MFNLTYISIVEIDVSFVSSFFCTKMVFRFCNNLTLQFKRGGAMQLSKIT
jgi:hypothetical protein